MKFFKEENEILSLKTIILILPLTLLLSKFWMAKKTEGKDLICNWEIMSCGGL